MKKNKIEIKRICDKCGKEQQPDEKLSNENWKVYAANLKCECGGKYTLDINSL